MDWLQIRYGSAFGYTLLSRLHHTLHDKPRIQKHPKAFSTFTHSTDLYINLIGDGIDKAGGLKYRFTATSEAVVKVAVQSMRTAKRMEPFGGGGLGGWFSWL